MMKNQHYMTIDERYKLDVLYNEAKLPVAQIAKILGFCRQTIITRSGEDPIHITMDGMTRNAIRPKKLRKNTNMPKRQKADR